MNFIVVSDPNQIQKIFVSSKKLTNKHLAVVALQNLFGASKEVAELFEDSEIESPASDNADETTSQGEARLKDHVSGFSSYARKYLSGPHLTSITAHFLDKLERNTVSLDIQHDWVTFPDLYTFLQDIVSRATIEALLGSKIFDINPNIVRDFWSFERGTPRFLQGFPRWLLHTHSRARDRISDTLKKLDYLAAQHISRLQPEDPSWEPYLGSKFLRARHEYAHFLKPLPDDTKAWEKMGIMFGYVCPSLM